MAEEKKVATSEAKAEPKTPETVPYSQFDNLYKQAVELDTRYKRLLEAYNALLDLYIAHK